MNLKSVILNSAIFYAASVPSVISDSDITLENYSRNQIKVLWIIIVINSMWLIKHIIL